jgi:hypothetical protein
LPRADVFQSVRSDATISEQVRRQALALAERYKEDPVALNKASWEVVRHQKGISAQYSLALRQAEAACRLVRDDGVYLTTLGGAQYRTGLYTQALETLARADELNAVSKSGPRPAGLALLAMTYHRLLGPKGKALATLERARALTKQRNWSFDKDSQALLQEAEALLLSE